MQRKNKDQKISTIIDAVNNGQIILVSDKPDSKKAIDKIMEFQGHMYSLHDDAPDNLAEIENKLKIMKVPNKIKIFDRRDFGI